MCVTSTFSVWQYKTVYKKSVHTRNVTLTLNLTDSLNVTDPTLAQNLSRVLHTIQVGEGLMVSVECDT